MRKPESERRRVASPPARPLLVFDGDCGFCRKWVDRWRGLTRGRVDYAPSREVAARFPEITPEAFARSVQLIEPSGDVTEGAEAVLRALAHAPGGVVPLWIHEHVPGVAAAAEAVYGFIARRRAVFSTITRWLWGASVERPTYQFARCLFLRLLGLVYLAAFLSLWLQIDGLAGRNGILPATEWLEAVRRQTGAERYWFAPTLCWLDAGDGFLNVLCGVGTAVSVILVLGLAPAACTFILWLVYLSLTTVSGDFLGFQWDNLLLETGLLAILVAPLSIRCRLPCAAPPGALPLALLRWLLFRLMFSSGAVKLLSGDPTWRDLTALAFHYETQPLPVWASWYAHQLPLLLHRASTLVMFVIELVVPFFVFAPRRPRLAAFVAMTALQTLIAATGNYAFFNLLTVALCLLLLDDKVWPARWLKLPAAARKGAERGTQAAGDGEGARAVLEIATKAVASEDLRPRDPRAQRRGRWPAWVTWPIGAVILITSTVLMCATLRLGIRWPDPIVRLVRVVSPLRSVNNYGLFAVMTTTRPEIVVEGSRDGRTWLPYEFKWKPGDLARRPRFVAPHQPRLDWQMWFAALADYRSTPWFSSFLARLLEGSPEVIALMERNPFTEVPPTYVRALLYEYHFTDFATGRRDGTWWRREPRGVYCPPVSLRRSDSSTGRSFDSSTGRSSDSSTVRRSETASGIGPRRRLGASRTASAQDRRRPRAAASDDPAQRITR